MALQAKGRNQSIAVVAGQRANGSNAAKAVLRFDALAAFFRKADAHPAARMPNLDLERQQPAPPIASTQAGTP